MKVIYEPRGKAREYSPLAANLYSGCGHKCSYCYVPRIIKMDRSEFDNGANPRADILNQLEKDAKKYKNSDKQVFMSFTTDPYNPIDKELQYTRKALSIFLEYKIPVVILTKSGNASLRDIDLFKKFGKHIKIGASLTYENPEHSQKIESGAALPAERLGALKELHNNGIRTWASFEPIISPEQTLNLIKKSIDFIDEYQLGKLSGDKRSFDWTYYLGEYVKILRENNKDFYIKETLRNAAPSIQLKDHEKEMDYLLLPKFGDELKLAI